MHSFINIKCLITLSAWKRHNCVLKAKYYWLMSFSVTLTIWKALANWKLFLTIGRDTHSAIHLYNILSTCQGVNKNTCLIYSQIPYRWRINNNGGGKKKGWRWHLSSAQARHSWCAINTHNHQALHDATGRIRAENIDPVFRYAYLECEMFKQSPWILSPEVETDL